MSDFWEAVAFYSIAAVIIASALGVVLMRNIVHCCMSLAASFFGVGCVYILLHSFFLFGVQLLIYVGAITVLVLFAIMLTRDPEGQFIHQTNKQSLLGFMTAAATFLAFSFVVITGHFATVKDTPPESVMGIGAAFVRTYVIPFEVASVVLLVALVGAIVIARDKEPD